MQEELFISKSKNKEEKYKSLLPQIEVLISDEKDFIANLANITAALKEGMDFFWVGFYIVKDEELVLGPFQGPIACTRIRTGKGVCGTAWTKKKTIVVPDVNKFPGHIFCSSDSKSEIVVPGFKDGEVFFVLDVDSSQFNDFDETDIKYLERLIKYIESAVN